MNYGLPYKGSKNKIAEWVVGNLPNHQAELYRKMMSESQVQPTLF